MLVAEYWTLDPVPAARPQASGGTIGRPRDRELANSSPLTRIDDLSMTVSEQTADGVEPFPFLHYFDAPAPDAPPSAHSVLVNGWVILPDGAEIEGPYVDHGPRTPLVRTDRPDVTERFRRRGVVGFRGIVPVTSDSPDHEWHLVVVVDGTEHRAPFRVAIDRVGNEALQRDKRVKLDRVREILRCPRPRVDDPDRDSCHGLLEDVDDELRCVACGERYRRSEGHFDFLSPELRTLGGVDVTDNVSDHGYDPWAEEIIDGARDGLVLDLGAGLRDRYLPNVVNFEIVAYPTTDVLGIGEHLPFATGSFDGLVCLAVLEHVRDPFRCAREIARVVRPGGRIYVAVPFLQPYHGYPHHYYNMTSRGLEQLFDDDFEIERSTVPAYGLPIWTLTWFLNSYMAGLPEATAKRFSEMKVKDLLGSAYEYLDKDFVAQVSEQTNVELACVNAIVGTKRA